MLDIATPLSGTVKVGIDDDARLEMPTAVYRSLASASGIGVTVSVTGSGNRTAERQLILLVVPSL